MFLLLSFVQCSPEWEIRHGSLLGIKYLVAVRQVLIYLLPLVLGFTIYMIYDV